MIVRLALALACAASPVWAIDLVLPNSSRLTAERNTSVDRFLAPVGVYQDGAVPGLVIEGDIRRASYRIGTAGLTPLQIMNPLKQQIEAAGYQVVLDCGAKACGGFDFRYEIEVLPGPNMYVDLRSYHVVTAVKGPEKAPDSVINIVASTAASSAYVQIITAGAVQFTAAPSQSKPVSLTPKTTSFGAQLDQDGHAVLSGLTFETGSVTLGAGPFKDLEQLADLLSSRPQLKIGLVGHTDSVGSLENNIALSRARAGAVKTRLIDAFGVDPSRVEAEGMGYLAPIASNLTADGREANRRVEVIVLSE